MRNAGHIVVAAVALTALLVAPRPAAADDRVDLTTTWYQENRKGNAGNLTVVHPQFDVGTDAGEHVSLGLGYSADIVSGATALIYSSDAISSATTFDDTRHEGRLSLGFSGRRSALTFSGGVGSERDYLSINVGASANIYLPGKNTNIALSYNHNFDQVCDRDNTMSTPLEKRALIGDDACKKKAGLIGKDNFAPGNAMTRITHWHDLSIDTMQATLTQNLSPTSNAQVALYGQILNGFQSNPYRRVRVSGVEAQEAVPENRARIALMVRYNKYLRGLRGAVHLMGRAYNDTWGLLSGTGEMGYSQYAGSNLLLRVRARVYQQREATFFKDAFFYETEGPAGAYFTGDRELGRLRHVTVGGKLSLIKVKRGGGNVFAFFDSLRLNLKGDILLLQELPADDINANIAGIDRQYLNSGQAIDAFVLQVGLLLGY
jgi:hypothetical protein